MFFASSFIATCSAFFVVSPFKKTELFKICNPKEVNELAFKDQDDMIEGYGGIEKAKQLGANAATPPPKL